MKIQFLKISCCLMLTIASNSCLSIPVSFSDATISTEPVKHDADIFRQKAPAQLGTKNSELTTLRNYHISESVDTDGDGLSDDEDPYPSDGTRPFYGDLISSDTAQAISWDNGIAQVGSQFQFTIQNDSSFDISLSEFIAFNGSGVQIGYTNDQSLLGGDGLLSVDEVTWLTLTLNDVSVGPIDLVYYYINPEDQTGETITARFNTDTSQVFGSYALDTDGDGEDNNTDDDDDGDGLVDEIDPFPLVGDVTWTYSYNSDFSHLDGNSVTVTGCQNTCPATLVIPDTIDSYTVTRIADSGFRAQSLISVVLPKSLLAIDGSAFADNQLTKVEIPRQVNRIGAASFANNEIESVEFNHTYYQDRDSVGLTRIESGAFYNNRLSKVTITPRIDKIESSAFAANGLTLVQFLGDRPTMPSGEASSPFLENPDLSVITYCSYVWWGLNWVWNGTSKVDTTADCDSDGVVDTADDDDDGDGVLDIYDAFPLDLSETQDTDDDGVGDNFDVFPNDPSETKDSDLDGIGDNSDWAPNDGSEWSDTDDDGVGNNADVFPNDATETADSDEDGVGDNSDWAPNDSSESVDSDGDGTGDNADADDDNDGVGDNADNCQTMANADQLDTDNDEIGDVCDGDDDNDGVLDNNDAFPLDVLESVDSDGDGVGDNADWAPNDSAESADSDGDGVGDNTDSFPFDATETRDTDGDGVGNNTDTDDDGDGVLDVDDAFPLKNTETKDSDGDGIGDNDEERAELIASDILSQKMISYAGSVAASFIDDIEDDYAGESDDWTIARGESVNLSIRCDNGGGYDATVTRSDWTVLTISMSIENCIDQNFMTTNGSATVTYDDDLWDQPTPREEHPFVFSFTNLRIHDTVDKTFSYTGSLYCDSHYNSIAQSWTNRYEGETEIYEGRWGSVFDDLGSVYWDNNDLEVDESGNTNVYVARYLPNCDFKNITVMEGAKNHTILDVQYVTESSGSGYNITGYTRSEKLEKVRNKEVFFRRVYTEELGWVLEIYSLFDVNAGVRLSGQGEYSINVYASTIPTYYWALRENVGDIIFQEVDQYSEFEWVYLDETTDKISANSNRYNWNSMWDIDNDGFTEVITSPWVISRFYSNSQWNRILRFEDWTVVAQGPRSGPISGYNTGFEVYDGEVWYQDTNLDGHNELFALDDDNDGVLDAEDNCQAVANLSQLDTDNDSLGNACDKDDDGDGVLDSQDTFPLDNTETSDSDLDGVGDNSDWAPNDSSESVDTDGDGVGDNADAFPTDATETLDTDGDGDGDNTDVDIDGDGLLNGDDPFPMQGQYTADSDSDGMPDAWETRYGLDPNDASDATSDQDNDGVSALDEFLAGTIPSGSLDIDGNENYDALTDGLLLLRGMFGLDGSALITGTIASDAAYTESVDIESRIATLGELADIDGNGEIDALTDGLLTLRYLFGLQGDTLINGVVASDATRKTAEEIEAHLETLMPAI